MTTTFCKSGALPDRTMLWQEQIFDTASNFQSITPKKDKSINSKHLQKAARRIAQSKNHRSYSHGICKNGSAWIFSGVASKAVAKFKDEVIQADLKSAVSTCKRIKVDFAPSNMILTKRLFSWHKDEEVQSPLNINTRFLSEGTLSITCKPRSKIEGHELWALLPIKEPSNDFPVMSMVNSDPKSLKGWVNVIRQQKGLLELTDKDPNLKVSSERLSKRLTVRHDRRILNKEKKRLKDLNIQLLGENRVIANDTKEMAWLLWNSPRHRNLVLHSKATHFSLATKTVRKKSLAVIVFAKIPDIPDTM